MQMSEPAQAKQRRRRGDRSESKNGSTVRPSAMKANLIEQARSVMNDLENATVTSTATSIIPVKKDEFFENDMNGPYDPSVGETGNQPVMSNHQRHASTNGQENNRFEMMS